MKGLVVDIKNYYEQYNILDVSITSDDEFTVYIKLRDTPNFFKDYNFLHDRFNLDNFVFEYKYTGKYIFFTIDYTPMIHEENVIELQCTNDELKHIISDVFTT